MSTILENLEAQRLAGPQSMYEMDLINDTGLEIGSNEYQQLCAEVNASTEFTDDEKDLIINLNYKGRQIKIVGTNIASEATE